MKRILVIGATSAIAEQCARLWAERGDALLLVGRNEERLAAMAGDLDVRGASKVATVVLDLNDFGKHQAVLDEADRVLGGTDVVLIAHGTLSDQKACERDVDLTMAEIRTNALSTIALLTLVANRLEAQRSGTIAVISSVAGDRGRASNYVYGSAKAMLTAFASGLRQRLHKSNVAVVTLKPGLVDTPMTAGFKKGPLWARPSAVAKKIVKAVDSANGEVYLPGFWRTVMLVIRSIPSPCFVRLKI
ncbi:SDR family oxidoreductase [Ramlibacter algicola]|uniref:SDR family oxidoreductase n=1 Tax=Ramlibacter algicola TaxID=2795217 RepID=A0A934Q038_9BURK|nr:SDR family oxidoreductase [Ramlibacter algicola]MBK0393755.1 SDR family oxidoreductase [Ramlibacter algicola]